MKKVLIIGGTGTVGSSFLQKYYDRYSFYNISRSEGNIATLKREYPKVESFIGDINQLDQLINIFEKVKPDVVIHTAAIKHIDLAEKNPTQTVRVNVEGSLNVIKASIRAKVPITVGVSTDKACSPKSVYGYSKYLMEKMFAEHYNENTKFVCTRFANVAHSKGSVIPFWKGLVKQNNPIKLTSPEMNRLMFSKEDSAELIQYAIESAEVSNVPFTLSKLMKNVNMLDLAKAMSEDIEIVGLRPGEKLNEALISQEEVTKTKVDSDYVFIYEDEQPVEFNVKGEYSSLTADKMNKEELKYLINLG